MALIKTQRGREKAKAIEVFNSARGPESANSSISRTTEAPIMHALALDHH